MNLSSSTVEIRSAEQLQEFVVEQGWSDGLPIVPPTEEAVSDMLQWAGVQPDHLLGIEPVRGVAITAEKIAINAIMAGCSNVHFPIVVSAWDAMLRQEFLLHGATSSTGGTAVLTILNGPILEEIGASGSFSALGGNCHATLVIGRAIRLTLINLLGLKPGTIDRSTLGHPGKISYCVAEDEAGTSWQSVAECRGVPGNMSAVTVLAAGSPRQIMNEWTTVPEEILDTYVAEIKANMLNYSIWGGNYVLVMPKQHRTHMESAGWSKQDIQAYVCSNAKVHRADWAKVGKGAVVEDKGDVEYAAIPTPDHLMVLAAGGPAGGFGAIIPPWLGLKSQAVTVPIGACLDC